MPAVIENKQTVEALINIGKAFILTAVIIPALSFLFRIISYNLLVYFSLGQNILNPLSAICYILLGIGIWIIREEHASEHRKFICDLFCFLVILINCGKLITSATHRPFLLDELLFNEQIFRPEAILNGVADINLMSPITSVILIMICMSVLINNHGSEKLYKYSQFLNYLTVLGAILTIYGYIYKLEVLYSNTGVNPISIHSAIIAFLLSSGILFIRPHKGSMATLIGQNSTQIVLLRFLAFFVPLILGWAKINGEDHGYITKELGTAFNAAAAFGIAMTLLGWKAKIQFQLRKIRVANEEQIKQDREKLNDILDLSPTTISIIDLETQKYIFTNQSSRGLFRYKNTELVDKKYHDVVTQLVAGDEDKKVYNRLELIKGLKNDEYNEMTYGVYNTEGKVSWIYTRAIGFEYDDGKPTKALINSVNFTKLKTLQLELEREAELIDKNNKRLSEVNSKLEDIQGHLEQKVTERINEIKESERACKDFFENSFEGILRYGLKGIDGIDTRLEVREQIKLIIRHAYLAEANNKLAEMHGYESTEPLISTPIADFLKMPNSEKLRIIKAFISADYKLENVITVHEDKNGEKIEFLVNLTGVKERHNLIGAWGTEIKAIDSGN